MRNFTAPLLSMSLLFSLSADESPKGEMLHTLFDPAEISHSRAYSICMYVLIVLAGLQADSSSYNRSVRYFCPKSGWALRYGMSGNGMILLHQNLTLIN